MSRSTSRRTLLRGLSIAAAGAAMGGFGRAGRAQSAAAQPLRLLLVFSPNATIPEELFPKQSGALSPILKPLERFRGAVTVLKGVNADVTDISPGNPHQKGMGAWLTGAPLNLGEFCGGMDCNSGKSGWASGPSVDQVLAKRLAGQTPFSSIELGVRIEGFNNRHRMSYRDNDDPVPPIDQPPFAFRRLFGEASGADVGGSVLDAVRSDIARIHMRADTVSRGRLEAHLESLRQLEIGAWASAPPSCSGGIAPPDVGRSLDAYPIHASQMVEIISLALGCGLTRVASLLFSGATAKHAMPWVTPESQPDLEMQGPVVEDFHSLTHAPYQDPGIPEQRAVRHKLIACWRYYVEQLAALADRLQAQVLDDGSTLLDNTLILWCSEMGAGDTHSLKDMPLVAIGGGAHGFQQGVSVDFGGKQINDVHSTILEAFGFPGERFGHPDYSNGPLGAWRVSR